MLLAEARTRDGARVVEIRDHEDHDREFACDMRTLIERWPVGSARDVPKSERPKPSAPLRPGKIVAIGLNYMDHVRETGMEKPERPLVFAKFPSSVVGPDEPIVIDPSLTARVDWEVELAVIVGRAMRSVPVADALDQVFGYTVANDVSARDVQFLDSQWVRGKSFDTFCPLGPVVATADEIPEPQRLSLFTRVNGETVQESTTAEMIFGVAELLAFCSHSFTLEPGDVLLTGTPMGMRRVHGPAALPDTRRCRRGRGRRDRRTAESRQELGDREPAQGLRDLRRRGRGGRRLAQLTTGSREAASSPNV